MSTYRPRHRAWFDSFVRSFSHLAFLLSLPIISCFYVWQNYVETAIIAKETKRVLLNNIREKNCYNVLGLIRRTAVCLASKAHPDRLLAELKKYRSLYESRWMHWNLKKYKN